MHFKTGKKSTGNESTDYETFIDYGGATDATDADCTKEIFDELGTKKSSVLINRDSDGSFVIPSGHHCYSIETRDSLPYYSKPIKLLVSSKTPSRESVVHTSTARLNIGKLKAQPSNVVVPVVTSQISNYGKRKIGAHMACEDLVNLDESIKIKNNSLLKRSLVDERHSMPTLFVGNRFNNSDVTEVYIPTYKDKKEIKQQTSTTSRPREINSPDSDSTTTHSSSLDLPAIVPAPDSITAELLYNFNNHAFDDNDTKKDIIKPPSMFDNSRRISLNRDVSPFNKHSLNSDKRIAAKEGAIKKKKSTTTHTQLQPSYNTESGSSSLRRCVSYQFVKLKLAAAEKTDADTPVDGECFKKKCTCCASSRCPSPRSSDSGMAGSCTISSPDPPKDKMCPSPFDTNELLNDLKHVAAGTNTLRHSRSSHNFGRFDLETFNDNNNHDSGQFGDSASLNIKDEPTPMQNMFALSTSRDTVKREPRCHSAERTLDGHHHSDNDDPKRFVMNVYGMGSEAIYKTGLYAHWWKKEILPNSMLRDLIVHNRDNQKGRRRPVVGGGSGKHIY